MSNIGWKLIPDVSKKDRRFMDESASYLMKSNLPLNVLKKLCHYNSKLFTN